MRVHRVEVAVVVTQQPAYGVEYASETKPMSSSGSGSVAVASAPPTKSAYGSSSQSSDLSEASLRQREEMLAQREAVLAQREESLKLKCVHANNSTTTPLIMCLIFCWRLPMSEYNHNETPLQSRVREAILSLCYFLPCLFCLFAVLPPRLCT